MRKIISGILVVLLVGCSGQRTPPTEEPTATPIPVVTDEEYQQVEAFISRFEERVKSSHKNFQQYTEQGSDIFYVEVNGDYTESQVNLLEFHLFGRVQFPEIRNSEHEMKMNEILDNFSMSVDQVTLEEVDGEGWLYKVEGTMQVTNYEEKLLELLSKEIPDTVEFWEYEREYMDSLPDMEGYPPSDQEIRVVEIKQVDIFEEIELVEVDYIFYLKKVDEQFYIYYSFSKVYQWGMASIECLSIQGEEFFKENNKTFRKISPWDQYFVPSRTYGWLACKSGAGECENVEQ